MDDYFYPYRIAGKEFPDQESYSRSNSPLSKDDWRRSNVDSIIVAISRSIKEVNKDVRFGISPFSVWRNKDKDERGSDSRAGQTNYDDLYADILLWLEKGWIDYVTPQLYLEIGHDKIAYEKLLEWWSRNGYGKHIYIGHGIYRATDKNMSGWKNPRELPNQLQLLRGYPQVQGSVYFSSKSFDANPNGWNDSLRNNYYRYPALLPPMSWIPGLAPRAPQVTIIKAGQEQLQFAVKPPSSTSSPIKYYVIYRFPAGRSIAALVNNAEYVHSIVVKPAGFEQAVTVREGTNNFQFYVSAVGKNNRESELVPLTALVKD
jgi:uncharacterized lipoprotein YddW (UPF0748 family)